MTQTQLINTFLDQSKHPIWIINLNYQLIYANRAYQDFIKDVSGEKRKLNESIFYESDTEVDIKKWKTLYSRAFEGEHFEIEEHFINQESNKTQCSQITFEPLVGDDGEVFAASCQSKDISYIVNQRSEAKQLIDGSLDVFCTINEKGNFVFVSSAAYSLWGYTPEELMGKAYKGLVLEEDIAKTEEAANTILSGIATKSFRNRYRKKDGGIAYNSWSVRWDESTKLHYCVIRDGKETIEQEEKLLRSEQRFKALVQGGYDLYAIIDVRGRYIYMSPSSTAIIGIPPEAFIGRDAFEFIHPDDIKQVRSSLKKVRTEGKVVMELYRAKNQYDEWRWVETVLTNMLDKPAVNGIVINSRDITEKIEQENEILFSQKRFEALVENSMDGVIIISAEGNTTYVSKSLENILGYSPKELMDMDFRELVHPDDLPKAESALLLCINNPGVPMKGYTSRVKHKNGSWRWIEPVITNLLHDPSIMGIVDNFRDITDEKNLRELNREVGKLAKIGSWEFDAVNNTIFWSDEVHQIYGTDPRSFVPKVDDAISFYREDYRDLALSSFERCIQTKEPYSIEAVIVNSNNKEVWVRTTAKAEFVDDVCTRVYGSFQDIDDTKQAEIRLQSLASNFPGVIFQYIINPDGTDTLKYVTEGSKSIWGYSREEVIQNHQLVWNRIKAGGELEKLQKSISDSIKSKTNWTSRFKYVMPSGELRTHLGNGTPTFLVDGTILFDSVVLDITQETQNEELLEQITDMSRIGSWEMDLINDEGEEMYWSPMLYEILELDDNYNPTLTGGIEFHIGESQDRIKKALHRLINEGIEFDEEILVRTAKGKKRWNRAIGKCETANQKVTRIYGSYQDIHNRKESQLELLEAIKKAEESDARFKAYTEQSPIAIYTTDINGNCIYANETWLKMSGMSLKDALGKGWISALHPDDLEHVQKNWYKSVKSNGKWSYEYRFIDKKQNVTWINGTAKELFNDKNELVGYLGSNVDITERKKAEQEKTSLRETIENSLNEIYTFDAKTYLFTYVNRGALCNLGYSEQEIKTLTPLDLKPDYTKTSFNQLIAPLRSNEKEKIIFFTNHRRKDGSLYPVEVHLQLVSDGNIKRFLAIILDITERKKAEEENNFKANLLSTIGQAAIATNLDGIVNYWNKAAEKIYGWKREEALGKNIMSLTTPDTSKEEAEKIMEVLKKGQTWLGEFNVQKRDGTSFPAMISNSPTYDEQNVLSGMIGISSDISEKVKNKQLLEQYTLELERSNEELEQFAFVASHDLQEPLRMVSSFMELLKIKYGDKLDEKGQQYIYFATDGAKRMKQIILDLLDYSRATKHTDGIEEVNFNDVLSEFEQLRRKLIVEKSAVIKSNTLPTLNTYKVASVQIIHCLLDNALKYTVDDTPPIIEINAKENETEWVFSIKDNGIGIEPRFHDKIFIIFQRLHNKDKYTGTGIGLAIVKRQVEFLGGKIWLESVPGEGTVFYFSIPKKRSRYD